MCVCGYGGVPVCVKELGLYKVRGAGRPGHVGTCFES